MYLPPWDDSPSTIDSTPLAVTLFEAFLCPPLCMIVAQLGEGDRVTHEAFEQVTPGQEVPGSCEQGCKEV